MNSEILWEKFTATGTVADYLEYCRAAVKKEHTDADNDGNSPAGALSR